MGHLEKRFPKYSKLLLLYPKKYRETYGEQMKQTLADILDDAPAKSEHIKIWTRLALDFPIAVTNQNVHYFGEIMAHESPKYVRRNGIIGGIMLLPFFLAILANGMNKAIYNQDLYHSWAWSMPVLAIWVLWLPLTAAIFGLATLLVFLRHQTKAKHETSQEALVDIRYNWPILTIALLGSFILALVFFHDSVHCVTGNPISETRHLQATWRCVEER